MTIVANVADHSWFKQHELQQIFTLLNDEGHEVRVVGGAVRNALMGLPISDIDMATTWEPQQVMARAQRDGIRAIPTGIDHGTVTLLFDRHSFEITTLRHDVQTDGRHAKVAFGQDWAADAQRRDFTINALYVDHAGQVIDLIGALEDLQNKRLKFIGDADKRIAEDHLRILRYFRFFAHYGSGRPDAAALKACARARDSLTKLSAERVWKELKLLVGAEDPGRALLWMRQAGVLSVVLPESEKWGIDSIAALVATETSLEWSADAMLRLMAIVPPDTQRMKALSARLKMSRSEAERLENWTLAPVIDPTVATTVLDRILYRLGGQSVVDRLRLALVSARTRSQTHHDALRDVAGYSRHLDHALNWLRPVFPVSGADLIAQGIAPGPAMGRQLSVLEERWIESNFTLDKDALLLHII